MSSPVSLTSRPPLPDLPTNLQADPSSFHCSLQSPGESCLPPATSLSHLACPSLQGGQSKSPHPLMEGPLLEEMAVQHLQQDRSLHLPPLHQDFHLQQHLHPPHPVLSPPQLTHLPKHLQHHCHPPGKSQQQQLALQLLITGLRHHQPPTGLALPRQELDLQELSILVSKHPPPSKDLAPCYF